MKKLSLIAALALGGLLVCSTAATAADAKTGKGKGHQTVEQQLDQMTKNLSLTDEQKPKVKAVLEETDKKMKDLSKEERGGDKGKEIRKEQSQKLKEILTPDQWTKMQEARKKGPGGEKKKTEKKTE